MGTLLSTGSLGRGGCSRYPSLTTRWYTLQDYSAQIGIAERSTLIEYFQGVWRRVLCAISPRAVKRKRLLVINPEDPLARFFHQRIHYSPEKKLVTRSAFMPSSERTTSVFHVVGLSWDDVSAAGTKFVAAGHGSRCYGWGEILAKVVPTTGLSIDYNNDPPRHADLI